VEEIDAEMEVDTSHISPSDATREVLASLERRDFIAAPDQD